MTSAEWSRIKQSVAEALDRPPSERAAYLAETCPDEAARAQAASLLSAVVDSADWYESPVLTIDGRPVTLGVLEQLPRAPGAELFDAPHRPARPSISATFHDTPRYSVRRRIGAGGMGIVYEVDDRERRQLVALKTLRRWDGLDIYRLKQEFRALAGIAHRNLVSLYDLVSDDHQCFFTMELVDGVHFVDYLRASGTVDEGRVRRTLAQLVDGLEELHRCGRVHRDIKPSNVIVTRDERVVILDFGLTSSAAAAAGGRHSAPIGSPAYVSPEQCQGFAATEASDWYSVGATLYHALTGSPPFEGSLLDVMRRKVTMDPPSPRDLAPGLAADLSDVCMALLRRDAHERMSGRDAMTGLGVVDVVDVVDRAVARATAPRPAFVGRNREINLLRAAFGSVRRGRSVPVYVHGPSGIGKTALVQHFIDHGLDDLPALVLRSRCHEHESIPYKGLDGVVDGLSQHLAALAPTDAAALMPVDAAAIARLFPVMRIEATAGEPGQDLDGGDLVSLRRRAFTALRALLARLAARQPIVIAMDDFHWADADSAASLAELLRPPDPPALLWLISFRTEEVEGKPFLRTLLEQMDSGTMVTLPLGPMTGDEVASLIDALMPSSRVAAPNAQSDIAEGAGGNPYLVKELTRDLRFGSGSHQGGTLSEMLQHRLSTLAPDARAFVETLAVCGRPIGAARIFEACGLLGDERPLVAALQAARLIRTSRSKDHVEMYHDRVRETLAATLAPERVRGIHDAMARILIAHGDDEPEALFEHVRGAGESTRAATYAAAAATRASQVLAFDRAASLYRDARALDPDGPHHSEWQSALARCLEHAGRSAEAADAYLAAAELTTGISRIECQRKAAEQMLMGGHIDRGLDIISTTLPAAGVNIARGPRRAVASMLVRRFALAWRGLDFEAREAAAIPSEDLIRIDTCWAISTGLMLVDTLRAASFHAGHLRMALDVGEPYRVARALALEASFSAARGGRASLRRADFFAARARQAAERVRHPHVVALSALTAGIAAFVTGQWIKATTLCEEALTVLHEQCTGVVWELTLAQNFLLGALMYRGQIRRVAQWLPALRLAARDRGNLYFETEISTRMGLVWLALDEPETYARQASEAMARWSDSGFHRQHYNYLIARIQAALYQGDAEAAWTLLSDHVPAIRRSLWLHVHFMRVEMAFVRARCALAMAAQGHDVRRMRATAARDARTLEKEATEWSIPLSLLVRAALAYGDGRPAEEATTLLARAIAAFDHADMRLYAAAARRQAAALLEGQPAEAARAEAEAFMRVEDIRRPAAMTRLLIPAFARS